VTRRRPGRLARPAARAWRRTLLAALVLAAAIAGVYANSLSGPFVLDDQAAVVQNQDIRDLSRPWALLRPREESPVAGRPLAALSFALNYALHGLDVRGYHVVNIALHAVCALLAYGVIRRTLAQPALGDLRGLSSSGLALAAALVWAVHPLNSEVVNYLAQRTESMMAAFYLLSVYAAIRAAPSQDGRWAGVAVGSACLGAMCKESMATLPVVVALYDRVFLFDSWASALRRRWRLYGGLALSWAVLAGVMALGPRAGVAGFSTGITPWTYLLNQAELITGYLRLAFWPQGLVVFYGWPIERSLADVAPHASLLAALAAATIAALLWRPAIGPLRGPLRKFWTRAPHGGPGRTERGKTGAPTAHARDVGWKGHYQPAKGLRGDSKGQSPLAGFMGAWFFLTLAPASSLVPIATEVGAERRMYLPLLGLVILVVWAAGRVWEAVRGTRLASRWPRAAAGVPVAVVAVVAVWLGAATVARNRDYQSPVRLAETVVERRPTGVAHHILGEQLALAGREREAVVHLREAVRLGNSRAGYLLGGTLFNLGQLDEALERLEAFVATADLPYRLVPRWLEPPPVEVLTARGLMAQIHASRREWTKSADQARAILRSVPSHPGARRLLADALYGQERWGEAEAEYVRYLNASPGDVRALINLGVAQVGGGKLDEAIVTFGRAAAIHPDDPEVRRLLAMAREDRERVR
jgi:Flp pilus assembly protein TadD